MTRWHAGRLGRRAALGTALVGTVALVLYMANREPLWRGPLWGASIALLTSAAWVAWMVPSHSGPAVSWRDTALAKREGEILSPITALVLGVIVLLAGALIGGAELLPVAILASLACLVPPALTRPGLAVMIVVAAMYLPLLGATGLWDPWETHYGEVAREILSRNDWISLWWAQDKWFWSKPALLFWMEAFSMSALGVDFLPDAHPAHPEWALRLPTIVMTFAALAAVYGTVRRIFDARAGTLAVLVTATMPQFFFLSHQAITDLPLVAAITIGSCSLLMALREDPTREAPAVAIGSARISARHAVLFLVIAIALPQALYLISRNVSWIEGFGLVAHPDRFLYGSAGNVDVPGNPSPRDQLPAVPGLLGQPFLQGLLWLGLLATLCFHLRKQRSVRALWMTCFYVGCALAFLAKGLPGLVIPGGAALFYLMASRRWDLLIDGQLRVTLGIWVVAVVGLPWYLAMYVRHGSPFTNRLLIHDHINRLAAGVHGDTGSIEYFVRQLGYAAFPWVALVPVALAVGLRLRREGRRSDRVQTVLFLLMWLVSSFVLFSAMVTKYHHYLLPSLVPLGILAGIGLSALWGPRAPSATVLSVLAGSGFVLGVAWLAGDPRGLVPAGAEGVEDWVLGRTRPALGWTLLVCSGALSALAQRKIRISETRLEPASWNATVAVALIVGACALAFIGRDLSWMTSARPQGNERLLDLFVYNYARPWPDHLDYRPILTGFAVAAGLLTALASATRWRSVGARALTGVAIAFCAWGLNVYMVDLAGHWSLRDLAARYYAERGDASEPLLAWQMNWKGENFYTGNRVYAFAETDSKRFKKWISENEGRRVYVVLEHNRLGRLKKLLPGRDVEPLSSRRENNKYLLVALEN